MRGRQAMCFSRSVFRLDYDTEYTRNQLSTAGAVPSLLSAPLDANVFLSGSQEHACS